MPWNVSKVKVHLRHSLTGAHLVIPIYEWWPGAQGIALPPRPYLTLVWHGVRFYTRLVDPKDDFATPLRFRARGKVYALASTDRNVRWVVSGSVTVRVGERFTIPDGARSIRVSAAAGGMSLIRTQWVQSSATGGSADLVTPAGARYAQFTAPAGAKGIVNSAVQYFTASGSLIQNFENGAVYYNIPYNGDPRSWHPSNFPAAFVVAWG